MKKNLSLVLALVLTLTLLLTGCGCKHEWKEATCTDPKTCSLCGEIEGEKLGHTWQEATCETAKTCSVCKLTEGEKLGHKWEDATTEAPKTCSVCKKTEGEKINTDERFKTANNKELMGEWAGIHKRDGALAVEQGYPGTLDIRYTVIFGADGTYNEVLSFVDREKFVTDVTAYYVEALYAEFKRQHGMDEAQADETMNKKYSMNVKEYAKATADTVAARWDVVFDTEAPDSVYYMENGKLYSSLTWEGTFEEVTFTLTDGKLVLDPIKTIFPDLVFTRVEK